MRGREGGLIFVMHFDMRGDIIIYCISWDGVDWASGDG